MVPDRRTLLRTAVAVTVGMAGCNGLQRDERADNEKIRDETPTSTTASPTEEPTVDTDPTQYKVQTPATVIGVNRRNKSQTVTVVLEVGQSDDRREVHNQSYEFSPENDTEIGKFEYHGQYHFTIETVGQRYEETVFISYRKLADCNAISPMIFLEESSVEIGVAGTEEDCPPATVSPTPTENDEDDRTPAFLNT